MFVTDAAARPNSREGTPLTLTTVQCSPSMLCTRIPALRLWISVEQPSTTSTNEPAIKPPASVGAMSLSTTSTTDSPPAPPC